MKIDDSIKKAAGLGVNTSPSRSGKAAEKASVDTAPSDNVTLSPKAQALANQGSGTGVFDLNKVNEIKDAIASGRFQINAERIADGLIDSVKDMISTRKA
ncbi:MAG: flagellar biosynthesis anti-sigma factor FlgM [Noviherbaspirillum sp.]